MSSPTVDYFRETSPSAAGLSDDELTLKIYDLTRDDPVYDQDQEFIAQAKSLDSRRAWSTAARSFGRGVTGMVGSIPEAVGIPLKQVTNLTGRTALYNFQSVFVGTRLVQPRTVAVRFQQYF